MLLRIWSVTMRKSIRLLFDQSRFKAAVIRKAPKITVFWDTTLCSLVASCQRLGETCCLLYPTLKIETASSSVKSVNSYQTVRCHIPEDSSLWSPIWEPQILQRVQDRLSRYGHETRTMRPVTTRGLIHLSLIKQLNGQLRCWGPYMDSVSLFASLSLFVMVVQIPPQKSVRLSDP